MVTWITVGFSTTASATAPSIRTTSPAAKPVPTRFETDPKVEPVLGIILDTDSVVGEGKGGVEPQALTTTTSARQANVTSGLDMDLLPA